MSGVQGPRISLAESLAVGSVRQCGKPRLPSPGAPREPKPLICYSHTGLSLHKWLEIASSIVIAPIAAPIVAAPIAAALTAAAIFVAII